MSAVPGWLSPTRAWRLIECPASVHPVAGKGPSAGGNDEINTGTLAHLVLERWIRRNGYRSTDPKAALAEAADACAAELPGGPPSSWRVSRARLIARGMSLVDLIGNRSPAEVLSEIELTDPELRLRGRLDLLLLGHEIVVVDLKTQTLLGDDLPASVEFQLVIYAHLTRITYGAMPRRAEVFSLNRGRREMVISEESLQGAITALATARAQDPSQANPSPAVCFFCDRRLICEPHWNVAPNWVDTDVVTGTVRRLEKAATGVVALLLDTINGPAWVSGIPLAFGELVPGDAIRVVRARRVDRTGDDVGEWRWQRLSALQKQSTES